MRLVPLRNFPEPVTYSRHGRRIEEDHWPRSFTTLFPSQALCGARTGQNGAMTAAVPDLSELRAGIDAVDAELVRILAERARLVEGVVRYKRANHMRVVDRSREELMLERIGQLATSEGLDSRVARQVLRTIIDSFTLLEVEELGPDA